MEKSRKERKPYSPTEDAELIRLVELVVGRIQPGVKLGNEVFQKVLDHIETLSEKTSDQASLLERGLAGICQRYINHLWKSQINQDEHGEAAPRASDVASAPAPEQPARVPAAPAAAEQPVVAENERVVGLVNRLSDIIRGLGRHPEGEARTNELFNEIDLAIDTFELNNQMAAANIAAPEAENEEHE